MENTDQQFNEIFDNYIKDFEKTPISQEQRVILPIIAFTVQGLPQQIKPYVQAADDQGVNEAKILEIIYMLEPAIGIGKVRTAFAFGSCPSSNSCKSRQATPR